MMKVKGYIISVPDLQQLLNSPSATAQMLLDTIPFGSNYMSTTDGIHKIGNGYADADSNSTLRFYANLKNIDYSCKIILMGKQYDDIRKALKEDSTLKLKKRIQEYEYIYNTDKIRGYQVRVADLYKLPIENPHFLILYHSDRIILEDQIGLLMGFLIKLILEQIQLCIIFYTCVHVVLNHFIDVTADILSLIMMFYYQKNNIKK